MDTKPLAKIVIVEDEVITAKDIEISLTNLGYRVVGTTSYGTEALSLARSERPDVVLMDIKLKGPDDGISAAQRIQNILNIPVVYLTAHSDEQTVKRIIHSKAYGYVVKPFVEKELHDTIQQALSRHQWKRRDTGTG
jgi:diguanylate cyclase